ncbi:MAG: methyltransferase domain-containing protein [Candidatus Omnitrophota bacterium]
MKTNRIECNLCGSNSYDTIYKSKTAAKTSDEKYRISEADIQKPSRLFRCNSCGLTFADQDRDVRYYMSQYADMIDREYLEEERGRRQASVRILKRIERHKRQGKILDIGCANGFLLDEARRRKWDAYGVEVSKWAVGYAREKFNLNVTMGTLRKAAFADGTFDVIVLLDVLEHLTDPKYTLIEIRRILKNDGVLYISTPDISSVMSRMLRAKWWGINKFHLYYFSKKTLEKMLDASGFKVKKYHPHIRVFSAKYWVKRFKIHSKFLYKMLDFLSRIGNLGKVQLKINLRDQIEAVAVKARKLDYLVSSASAKREKTVKTDMKAVVVLPAYNAEKTLKKTVDDIPKDVIDKIILVDDNSTDRTVEIAESLGLIVVRHKKNMGLRRESEDVLQTGAGGRGGYRDNGTSGLPV